MSLFLFLFVNIRRYVILFLVGGFYMSAEFISLNYIALSLIEAKYEFFREGFITRQELHRFRNYIQRFFIEKGVGFIIVDNELTQESFVLANGVIKVTERCCYDLNQLPSNIEKVLRDTNLILQFFIQLESEKLEILNQIQLENPNLLIKSMSHS